jgi:NADH-quinone oxidoreductase subunit B
MPVNERDQSFEHPLFGLLSHVPGMGLGLTTADIVLTWGLEKSLWAFPMATSCCGIEFMATMTARFDMEQFGTFTRPTPRQCDVMVMAGTITVKMAPRILKLWDFMPEPKWCIAMGSCAISGDFYRDIYSVVPGIDALIPVDVYVPGCPPNPDHFILGMHLLARKIHEKRAGTFALPTERPERPMMIHPRLPAIGDPARGPEIGQAQLRAALEMDPGDRLTRLAAPVPGAPVPGAPVPGAPVPKSGAGR